MSTWKQEAARKELHRVACCTESGPLRAIKFRTETGPFGNSLFEWISVERFAWQRSVTLMHDRTEPPPTVSLMDLEVFNLLWDLYRHHYIRGSLPPTL